MALRGFSGGGPDARQAGERGLYRQLHQRAPGGPAGGGHHIEGAQSRQGRASPDRAGIAADQTAGGGRGSRRYFQGGGSGLARVGLLDVPRNERRHGRCRPVFNQHQQPKFRGPAGKRRADIAGQPLDRGRERSQGQHCRSTRDDVMQPIKRIVSKTVVIASSDIDTDQIIPARFLTTTTKEGLGKQLFADWRYRPDGSPRTDFVLNSPEARGAEILVAGRNFGCGSSREHAPWALLDYGFRAVISTEIADIFRGNSLMNGFLPIVVDEQTSQWLLQHPGAEIEIDLA